jgi:hypothetical protein
VKIRVFDEHVAQQSSVLLDAHVFQPNDFIHDQRSQIISDSIAISFS